MADYDNTNRFSIWRNEKKQTDKDADFTGELDIDGVKYFIDAWKRKEGAAPKAPALSGKVKRKEIQARKTDPISSGRLPPRQNILPADDMNDDVPF